MSATSIEWVMNTDGSAGETWNPIRARNTATGQVGTHCVKISPGCANCYAEAWNARNLGASSSGLSYTAAEREAAEYFINPKILAAPLRRKKAQTYFVCSMTDLFLFPPEMVAAVFGIMAACPQHTFQVLTKRTAEAIAGYTWIESPARWHDGGDGDPIGAATVEAAHILTYLFGTILSEWPLPNVWTGVSVEDRTHGLPRIDVLRQIPAALRFLSIEPLLEDLGEIDLTGIDWVIVGGESGHGARPLNVAWVRSIIRQCRAAGVPVFVKQFGLWVAPGPGETTSDAPGWSRPAERWLLSRYLYPDGSTFTPPIMGAAFNHAPDGWIAFSLGDRRGATPDEWPEDLRIREMPEMQP